MRKALASLKARVRIVGFTDHGLQFVDDER